MSTKREYPFFSAVLDLMAIHSKKVSLIATVVTSMVISIRAGHYPFQFLNGNTERQVVFELLMAYAGLLVCFYALVHALDFFRTESNAAFRKFTTATFLLVMYEWLHKYLELPGGASEYYHSDIGLDPLFIWWWLVVSSVLTFGLMIYAYVDGEIERAVER